MVDPVVFPDGEVFEPERFMNTSDPRLLNHRFGCFGFGRRICPGMHVALQSLYIVIARCANPSTMWHGFRWKLIWQCSMLWCFDVQPTVVDGKPFIPDSNDFTTGLVSYPANLKYQLVSRSEKHNEIIMAEASRADADMAYLHG
jgi:hypothetical protein